MQRHYLIFSSVFFLLAGCEQVNEQLGLEDPVKREARLDADGRAVGGGCRQSGRAIEDCYAIYSWLPRASVFAGWRDMDAYMRENKIETVEPQLPPVEPPGAKKRTQPASGKEEGKAKEESEGETGKEEKTAAEKTPGRGAEKSGAGKDKATEPEKAAVPAKNTEKPVDKPLAAEEKKAVAVKPKSGA